VHTSAHNGLPTVYQARFWAAEKAVVNNISNLEWAVKRNIEDAFMHFEGALSEQLDKALRMTREAFQTGG